MEQFVQTPIGFRNLQQSSLTKPWMELVQVLKSMIEVIHMYIFIPTGLWTMTNQAIIKTIFGGQEIVFE